MGLRTALLSVGLMAACSGGADHSIDTSHYSHACVADADCVAVYQGPIGCCGADCPNTVIAVAAYDDYQAALASRTPTCNPAPPCASLTGVCGDRSASCVGGMCTLATASTSALSASPHRAGSF